MLVFEPTTQIILHNATSVMLEACSVAPGGPPSEPGGAVGGVVASPLVHGLALAAVDADLHTRFEPLAWERYSTREI